MPRGRKANVTQTTKQQNHRLQVIANNSERDVEVYLDSQGVAIAQIPREYLLIVDRKGVPLADACSQPNGEWVWNINSWRADNHDLVMHLIGVGTYEQADRWLRDYVEEPLDLFAMVRPAHQARTFEADPNDVLLA